MLRESIRAKSYERSFGRDLYHLNDRAWIDPGTANSAEIVLNTDDNWLPLQVKQYSSTSLVQTQKHDSNGQIRVSAIDTVTGDTPLFGTYNTIADYQNLGKHPGGFPMFAYLEGDGSINFSAFGANGIVQLYEWQIPLDAFAPGNINNQTGSLAFTPANIDTLVVLLTAKDFDSQNNVFYISKGTLPGSFVMEETVPIVPLKLSVYPNPFKTEVALGIEAQKAQTVSLDIYNIRGQKVHSLTDITLSSGENTIRWDGTNDRKQAIGSGIYLVRVRNRDGIVTRKILKL